MKYQSLVAALFGTVCGISNQRKLYDLIQLDSEDPVARSSEEAHAMA